MKTSKWCKPTNIDWLPVWMHNEITSDALVKRQEDSTLPDFNCSVIVAVVMPEKRGVGYTYRLPGRGVLGGARTLDEAKARVDTLLSEFRFTEV